MEKGTSDRQQVLVGDLDSLPKIVRSSDAKAAPTLIIIGSVVKLHHNLAWFNLDKTLESS